MDKKKWGSLNIEIQQFIANEYISSCSYVKLAYVNCKIKVTKSCIYLNIDRIEQSFAIQ